MSTPNDPRTSNVTPPTADEAEGHIVKPRFAKPETDQESEVAGHGFSRIGNRQIDAVPGADEPEVEGHRRAYAR